MNAKVAVEHQVGQVDRALDGVQKALQLLLNTLQLWIEHHFCLVFVTAALWPFRFSFEACWFGFLGLAFSLAIGLFFFCADHLFHTDRIRTSLLGADQDQCEKGQPWYDFLPQAGEEVIRAVHLLACFCDHTLISCQHIGITIFQQVLTKESPEYLGPGNERRKETLHRPVAAIFLGPSR